METNTENQDANEKILSSANLWLENTVHQVSDIVKNLREESPEMKDQERVDKIIAEFCKTKSLNFPSPQVAGKNIEISVKARTNGNVYFQMNNLDEACAEYTKSIAYAPLGSQELGLAFANRSAVLFNAEMMNDCLKDIDRALKNNYPDNLKVKLYYRKAACCRALNLNDRSSMKISLSQARQWLDKMDKKNQTSMKKKLDDLEASKTAEPGGSFQWNYIESLPKLKSENSLLLGLTDAVKLEYSNEFGRHIIAMRDINPGEVLGVQKPYTKIIIPEMIYKLCWHCGQQAWSGLPCPDCCDVIFCSTDCLNRAQQDYHDIECHAKREIRGFGLPDEFFIGLRSSILGFKEAGCSFDALKKLVDEIENVTDPLKKGLTNGKLEPKKFASAYCLKPHRFTLLRDETISFVYSLVAAHLLVKWNKKDENSLTSVDQMFKFVIRFIDKNIWIMCCNQYQLGSFVNCELPQATASVVVPVFSFMNSSCVPTINRSFCGEYVINTVIRPIKKGEQVFESYVMGYWMQPREARQEYLNDFFHFTCKCKACINDWPVEALSKPKNHEEITAHQLWRDSYEQMFSIKGEIMHKIQICYRVYKKQFDITNHLAACVKILLDAYRLFEENSLEVVQATKLLMIFLQMSQKPLLTLV